MIDAYASLPHYWAHIEPIWRELAQRGVAGDAYSPRGQWGVSVGQRRGSHTATRPVIVASYADVLAMNPAPVVYVEHGSGQTYGGDPKSAKVLGYSGALGLERVVLFLSPHDRVAQRWRAIYPSTPAVAVGCPRLDRHHRQRPTTGVGNRAAVVAVTFHWDCRLIPETMTAWPVFNPELGRLAREAPRRGWYLLGHGHPRLWGRIERRWRQLHVDRTPDIDDVLERADVLVADNTSALFEFASLGKPVVVLNAPWYRRDVHHGGRFWEWADVGVQVDTPQELAPGIASALHDTPERAARRRAVIREVYAPTDGHAAERAADAIVEVICGDTG